VDVSGLTGMTLRGNLGYMGRVLFMVDGQEMNELFYSCSYNDNHYPVQNIKKIEIIRGPGSAIYGGFAELGVINIITKNGEDVDGISASVDYGINADTYSHRSATITAGKRINEDMMFSVSGFVSQANRSTLDNPDMYGDSYNMTDESGLQSVVVNANAEVKGVNVRAIYDDYTTNRRDQYDFHMAQAYDTRYRMLAGEVNYPITINDKITITPKYNVLYSTPWQTTDPQTAEDEELEAYEGYDRVALRNKFNLTASMNFIDELNVLAGVEYVNDYAEAKEEGEPFWDGNTNIGYNNMAAFAQGIYSADIANFTLGIRADNHSQFGLGIAPRVGVTKAWEKFHGKVLLSQAFRSPSIDEVDYAGRDANNEPDIEPEVTRVVEAEFGYNVAEGMQVVANLFYSRVDNSILYMVVGGEEVYSNGDVSGTQGFEIEYKLRKKWGFVNLSYSYYNNSGLDEIDYYNVIEKGLLGYDSALVDGAMEYTPILSSKNIAEGQVISSSPHKVALNASYNVFKGLAVNPSFVFSGPKYAYTTSVALDEDEEIWVTVPEKIDPLFIFNLNLVSQDLIADGLRLSLGVHNILGSKNSFYQPYDGWHGPLPGEDRRFSANITYDLKL
jgi:outer membrane cobalamin receptor